MNPLPAKDIDYLLSTTAIRERTRQVFDLSLQGGTHFKVNLEKLDDVSQFVLEVINEKYPDLVIPFHSRTGHLNAGKNRINELATLMGAASQREIAKAKIDLIVVSVLLDAGAGNEWKYFEKNTNRYFARSEGLAVASYHMFKEGAFSGLPGSPLRAGFLGLKVINEELLKSHFQVTDKNALLGVQGRVVLLNELGLAIERNPQIFKSGRVGDLLDHLTDEHGQCLRASQVLDFVLRFFGDIWPSRLRLGDKNLGDVWAYPPLGKNDAMENLIPFHKLSQWLTYSLLVPMIEMGIEVIGVDDLTGLAEYRNGGLLIDLDLVEARDPKILQIRHAPQSEVVVEWRSLTVVLLDQIADKIREKLKMTKEELPLAKVLEGGTWHAGRKIAKLKRTSGGPPLDIISDGTVF